MAMITDAQRGEFSVILVDDKDRFGRFDSITSGSSLRQRGSTRSTSKPWPSSVITQRQRSPS